jgi:hypothetical protein
MLRELFLALFPYLLYDFSGEGRILYGSVKAIALQDIWLEG